ncbi:MAG: TolC family outer membrane protein [Chromatiales bacterium]|nr:TolC family outer membrane protein [Chromatiales bacterium]
MIKPLQILSAFAGLALAASTHAATDVITAYDQALAGDPQLRAARASRDAVREAKPQARARLLPAVSFEAGVGRVRQDRKNASLTAPSGVSYFDDNDASLVVVQPVYRKDYWVALEQADASIAQAEAQYGDAAQDLIIRVAERYFGVLSGEDDLGFAQAELKAIGRQLDQARQRFDVGLIAITPVHEARAAFDAAQARVLVAQNALDNAHESLREVTGQANPSLEPLHAKIELALPSPSDPDAWSAQAAENNLGVIAARNAAEVARSGIELARSGHHPTVDLVGSHAYSESASRSETTALSLQLSVPLYLGGSVVSATREAQFRFEQSTEELERARRSADRQVRDAYRGVVSSAGQVEAFRLATVSAQSALDASEAGFEVGTRTIVDVLNAQRDLFAARRDYAQSRYNYLLNGLRLKRAAGTLTRADLDAVNRLLGSG